MCICLSKSLTAAAQAKLLACRSEFTFDNVKYGPLMYKVIMNLTTMDSVATTQSLRENLQNLATYAATVLVGKSGGIPPEFRGIPNSGPFF